MTNVGTLCFLAIDWKPWSRSSICYKSRGKDGLGFSLQLWWSKECYHGKGAHASLIGANTRGISGS